MKNILITNDDGVDSDGIKRLAEAAKRYGNVYVVAPDGQRSAMSHSITLREPIYAYETDIGIPGVKAYKTTGTPADCVRFGVLNIIKGNTDAVLSGINLGYNSGSDIQYSATVGAAMEAASKGLHAIAVSEGMGDCHEVTDRYLTDILDEVIDRKLGINEMWNINFPLCPLKEFKGIIRESKVSLTSFWNDRYEEEILPDGGIKYTVSGTPNAQAEDGTDFKALLEGYISVGLIKNITHIGG